MASFEIPDGPTEVELGGGPGPRTGSASYTVTNRARATLSGRVGVQPVGATNAQWFTIAGERERDFAAGESQTVAVTISVPADVQPGDYKFRLRAVAVNDPDNDFTDSPVANVRVMQAAVVPPKKFPAWAIAAIALMVLVLGVGGYFALRGGDEPKKAETATAPWFVGAWTGQIHGRPAAMRWRMLESGSGGKSYVGEFSDGNTGTYVPMTLDGFSPTELFFRHPDGNQWFLRYDGASFAEGFTRWQGAQYPLSFRRDG